MLDNDTAPLGLGIGTNHTLAVNSKGQLFAWGVNSHGQCGVNTKRNEGKFQAVPTIANVKFRQVACGDIHSLGIDYDGDTYIWGGNDHGQLGIGNYEIIKQPRKIVNYPDRKSVV